jgi:hypothetical protein
MPSLVQDSCRGKIGQLDWITTCCQVVPFYERDLWSLVIPFLWPRRRVAWAPMVRKTPSGRNVARANPNNSCDAQSTTARRLHEDRCTIHGPTTASVASQPSQPSQPLLLYKRMVWAQLAYIEVLATVMVRACVLTGLTILFHSMPYGIAEIANP